MKILGIDYGRRKIGLAFGDTDSKLARPHSVIKVKSPDETIKKIGLLLKETETSQIVIGISDGEVGKEARKFGERLENELKVDVSFQDETLTTQDAQSKAIAAGIKRKKRKSLEDAFAATLILQEYLDVTT